MCIWHWMWCYKMVKHKIMLQLPSSYKYSDLLHHWNSNESNIFSLECIGQQISRCIYAVVLQCILLKFLTLKSLMLQNTFLRQHLRVKTACLNWPAHSVRTVVSVKYITYITNNSCKNDVTTTTMHGDLNVVKCIYAFL